MVVAYPRLVDDVSCKREMPFYHIYVEPKIREPFHFEVSFILHIKIYDFQVNIWCELYISSPVSPTDVKHVDVTWRSHSKFT